MQEQVSGFGFQAPEESFEVELKPDTRHLKPFNRI